MDVAPPSSWDSSRFGLSRAWGRLLAWLIAAGVALSPQADLYGQSRRIQPPATRPAVSLTATPRTVADLRAFQGRVESVVQQVMPSVVAIIVGGSSQGSGVVVSSDGLILTAAHVTADAGRNVWIIFPDGRRVHGRTLGLDRMADAGMIRITDKGDWPAVKVGRSATLRPGEWCIAMGHPGGFQKGRTPPVRLGRIITVRSDTIMSSCTLVGGDSGGPLFSLDGKLIGIHSRIGPPTAYNIHVPIDAFTRSWDRMVAGEAWGGIPAYASGPMLGVILRDRDDGVEVESVVPGSAAEEAGVKPGDLIVRFARQSPKTRDEMAGLIARRRVGDVVRVEVLREGKRMALSVKLQSRRQP